MKKLFCTILSVILLCSCLAACQTPDEAEVKDTAEQEVKTKVSSQTFADITFEIPESWTVKADKRDAQEPSIAYIIDEHTEILFSYTAAFDDAVARRDVIAGAPSNFPNYKYLGTVDIAEKTAEHLIYDIEFDAGTFSMEEYTFSATGSGLYCIDIKRDADSSFAQDDPTIIALLASVNITETAESSLSKETVYHEIKPELQDILLEIGAIGQPQNVDMIIIYEVDFGSAVEFLFTLDGKEVIVTCISMEKDTDWRISSIISATDQTHYYWVSSSEEAFDIYDLHTEELISPATKTVDEALGELQGE